MSDWQTSLQQRKQMRRLAGSDGDFLMLLGILGFVLALAAVFMPNVFYTAANFKSMAYQFPEFGLMATGMALSMITGGTDLSVVNTGNLSAIIAGTLIHALAPDNTASTASTVVVLLGALVGMLVGCGCGTLNGFLVAKVGIPPILATLGTMQLFSGIGIVITKGVALYDFPPFLNTLGNGAAFGVIPYPLITFAVMMVIVAFLVQRCKFGFSLYLMGSNPVASSFSGIDNTSVLIRTYMLSGLLSGIAGIIILTRNNSVSSDYGASYILQTILVAIMAGFNPSGGKGRITSLVLAVITLQVLGSGLNMTNVTSFFKQLVYGAMLLLLVIYNTHERKPRKKHLAEPGATAVS